MNRGRLANDAGSVTPLILGFFLIGLLMVAGAVLAGASFSSQRDLQSICDGAAIAAANSLDSAAARTQPLAGALPLAQVQRSAADYLARDPSRATVRIRATLTADGQTVLADCRQHVKLAFEAVIGRRGGIEEHATASARGVLR